MAGRAHSASETARSPAVAGARVLLIDAPYYGAIAEALLAGAIAELEAAGAAFERCVALGCVIRGETTHYETVCANANHWLMEIAVRHAIPLGNAILTVETEDQALARAEGGRCGKGADAVRACLSLIGHARAFAARRA
jgi:6,7-dimethyl-8-ribityllumazine synthase